MAELKQVDKSHYAFASYMDAGRWASIWQQLHEVLAFKPRHVLEIGPGPGVFCRVAGMFDVPVETLDVDPELRPDHVGSATALPFVASAYDVVCAFQMLEHLPYGDSLRAFSEMARVAGRAVVISVPDIRPVWRYSAHVPRIGMCRLQVPKPGFRPQPHVFDGEHHWEIGKLEYPLKRVAADFADRARLVKTYRLFEDPYYRFFVFEPAR